MRDHPPAASEGVWQVMSQPTRRRGRLRSGGAGPSIASIIAGRDVNTLNNPSGGAATIHRQHHCRPGWLHAHQSLSYEGVWHGGQVGSNASALPRLARAGTALPKMAMGVRGRLLPSPTGFSQVSVRNRMSISESQTKLEISTLFAGEETSFPPSIQGSIYKELGRGLGKPK